jgi:L-asparaginase II
VTAAGVVLARLVRNGIVESVHTGSVVICDGDGATLAVLGDGERSTYVRSSVKPFQALAVLDALDAAGLSLDQQGLAIACASHDGSDEQQIEVARLLAEADLDESALQCPPALPRDPGARDQRAPTSLAHNCSGKHASFLLAAVVAGEDPARSLVVDSPLQQRILARVAESCSAIPTGPGIDGCGAPAWLLPLDGLATGFARLAAGATPQLERVRDAMTSRPLLIGGPLAFDSQLMAADPTVVAKRGAEAVFAAGSPRSGGLGIAVKVDDGGPRGDGTVAAAILDQLGNVTPADLRRPPVLGGGAVQGALEVDEAVLALTADL